MIEKEAKLTGAESVAWDLSDIYAGVDDPQIDADMQALDARADALSAEYRGRVAGLDNEEMRCLIEEYEAIYERAVLPGYFAYLLWSTNTEDQSRGALRGKTEEWTSRLQQKLLFVELEWANAPDEKAQAILSDPVMAKYRHFLTVARLRRPYLLSEPEEKILSEKAVTGRNAWARYFNEVHGAARYEWEGEKLPLSAILNIAARDPERENRKKACEVVTGELKGMARTNTYIMNTLLADKASDDRLRGFPTWISSRNLDNQVDDASVEALVSAVTSRYDIVARFYRLKARLLGVEELFDYDRYAPLPAADREYTWDEATGIVLDAYDHFSPRLSGIVQEFFDKNWIDAPVRPGKWGGAYSAGMTPRTHPYILLNYLGKPDDVMTLAHELGHGIHQYLARVQGMLHADTPLTTAETASTFGEMLTFRKMMAEESDPKVQLAMLTNKIEGSFATIHRQISMNRFEHAVHTARREQGELSTDQINEFWLKTQRDMFQDSVTMTENYGIWWSYVPHFIDVPGYVYAYAFGELLVFALYARYEAVGADFVDGYIQMLSAGGSDWPHEIVRPLGVDLTDPTFWTEGLGILDEMVNQAVDLAGKAGY
jgi:oligoendopeptidase F